MHLMFKLLDKCIELFCRLFAYDLQGNIYKWVGQFKVVKLQTDEHRFGHPVGVSTLGLVFIIVLENQWMINGTYYSDMLTNKV